MRARISYQSHRNRERSNLIVLVKSEVKHKILQKNIEKRELEAIFLKNDAPEK